VQNLKSQALPFKGLENGLLLKICGQNLPHSGTRRITPKHVTSYSGALLHDIAPRQHNNFVTVEAVGNPL